MSTHTYMSQPLYRPSIRRDLVDLRDALERVAESWRQDAELLRHIADIGKAHEESESPQDRSDLWTEAQALSDDCLFNADRAIRTVIRELEAL